jgi:hypothetical protein
MTETCELTEEVQDLVWALVDNRASDRQVRRLEELLAESDAARQTYVHCVQMHADLHLLLGGKRAPPTVPEAAPATGGTSNWSMEDVWSVREAVEV